MLEFTDKIIGDVIIKLPITEKDIENIIVTCFEGGSNYWMGVDTRTDGWEERPKDEPKSTWATKMLLENKAICLFDIEDETENFILTLNMLLDGIRLNREKRSFDCDLENGDATTCDCILQYALFSSIVYG